MWCPKTSELAKKMIESEWLDVSIQPEILLSCRPGTEENLGEVLSLFITNHVKKFIPMILGLKDFKSNENIMHCLAKNELLDIAKKLIETIKKYSDPINTIKLMFARDSRSGNSAMMVMMTRRMYR